MMMSLGMYGFELATVAYDELQRRTDWRHADSPRVGARAANQYVGPGEDRITLSGLLAPEIGNDPQALDDLRDMADEGEAWPLVDGTGVVYGAFVITGLDVRKGAFFPDGAARAVDFTLDLRRVPDEAAQASTPTIVGLF